MNPSMIKSVPI